MEEVDGTTYTTSELAKRRELAVRQLLAVYETEYLELMKSLGDKATSWPRKDNAADLTTSQKSVLVAKYEEFLKGPLPVDLTVRRVLSGRFVVHPVQREELEGFERFGIPVVSEQRVESKGSLLSFAQAEVYLGEQIVQCTSSARLEPHLQTASPHFTLDERLHTRPEEPHPTEDLEIAERSPERQRLEIFACSICYRWMDRQDDLVCFLGHQGRYAVRRNAFTIGCVAELVEPGKLRPAGEMPMQHSRKRKAEGEFGNQQGAKDVDVDLALEGGICTQTTIYARVWLKADGRFCIKCTGPISIYFNGKQLVPGEITHLEHWGLMEIEEICLMVLINQNAVQRLHKRSRMDLNI